MASVETLSPSTKRIRFTGDDLATFESASPDDHVKLFFPLMDDDDAKRDYTPRSFSPEQKSLTIDFVLHDDGPATSWARNAVAGDELQIGGPRGSAVVADDFDWYLLVGDETATPSIARRIEELRPDVPVRAILLCDDEGQHYPLPARDRLIVDWVYRANGEQDDGALLIEAIGTRSLPEGEGYVWIAAEAEAARAARTYVVEALGHPKAWVKAAGYWIKGAEGQQTKIED